MSKEKESSDGRKGGSVVFTICVVIIVALLLMVVYLLVSRPNEEEGVVNRNVVVNEENVEEVLSELETVEKVPAGRYQVTMNSTWNFVSGDMPSDNAYVENSVANTNAVYFDIMRKDTEETIYESPILPVGSHLEEIILDSVLPAGTYDCLVVYHLLDEENRDISTVKLTLEIIIAQ